VMAKLFRQVLLPGPPTPLVLELPPYRLPTLRGVLIHMWERGWLYVKKAGTVILAISVVIWALSTFPRAEAPETTDLTEQQQAQQRLEHSYAGRIGGWIAPVLRPAGLGQWKIGTALFAGFGAKEVVVSTLGTLYGLGETDERSDALREELRRDMTPLQGYALMVFVLLYIPCLATVAVIKRESNSWRWPLFTVAYTTLLAWGMSTLVYQLGRLFGLG
jgi:ferrous iron transport protein B